MIPRVLIGIGHVDPSLPDRYKILDSRRGAGAQRGARVHADILEPGSCPCQGGCWEPPESRSQMSAYHPVFHYG